MALGRHRVAEGLEIVEGGAAFLTREQVLVVADMHLGAEAVLEYEGLSIPRVQTREIERYLAEAIRQLEPSKVVVAGDLKHNFSRNLNQEWQDVSRFVEALKGRAEIEVTRGNHDNFLGVILAERGVPMVPETESGGIRILHGHKGEYDGRTTVMAHLHPSLRLRDEVGASLKDRCFLWERRRAILILPALSLVAYGTDLIGHPSSDRMSPLTSGFGLSDFVPIVFSNGRALRFPKLRELRAQGG